MDNHIFRSAIGGFHRQDVMEYIERTQKQSEENTAWLESQVEQLQKYRLDVPQVTLLAHELKKAGLPVPDGVLTVDELVEELCRCK